ncbi:MAG: selenide, water dikinase SelD, partial [Rhodocyclaceae bacterium]|nr:selenide, water dikinase SelD [Rhodocyclaceae bacterium]
AIGVVHPAELKTNALARTDDLIVLGKPLGIGVYSAALRKNLLEAEDYAEMLRWTTTLNRAGSELAKLPQVHALTDVTGFGLAGHLLEICRASGCAADIEFSALPLLRRAAVLARKGVRTGASARNFAAYSDAIHWPEMQEWQKTLLTDPQTSGGLLATCAPDALAQVQAAFAAHGCEGIVIGRLWRSNAAVVRVC